uniref:phosphoglycerate mutase (2,3-diphosphoglycerate-independent) n=1 Tax=Compsopogon caeruleus TaxID=31354 RepID=A0A7S1TDY4_9RHOD
MDGGGVSKRSAVLICIDGWGLSKEEYGNAILNADTPVMDGFAKGEGSWAELDASGLAVGLPEDVMGNSEVGHLTIGAGRPEYQDLVRINLAMAKGEFGKNERFQSAIQRAKEVSSGRIHLLGLLSDGGVHSHIQHLFEFLAECKEAGVENCFVHAFGDGRDTPPKSMDGYVQQLIHRLEEMKYGKIGLMVGRYYAMDRDKRWDRVELAVKALITGEGAERSSDPIASIKQRYEAGETDEFLKPILINEDALIRENDTLLFFNYRSDRMREINETLGIKPPFETALQIPANLQIFAMTQYNAAFPFPVLYPPQKMDNVLSEWLSKKGIPQFHCAETEKYAHVTFFFNGGREICYDGEEREMIPSPKVPTYDKEPKMSQEGVASAMIKAVESGKYPFIMCNFAAPDMVGHTGVYEATIEACTDCDKQIGRIWEACQAANYLLLVTADHGNAEKMKEPNGDPITKHSTNFVPLVCMDPSGTVKLSKLTGTLADVAPTILTAMGLPIPEEMTGSSLV